MEKPYEGKIDILKEIINIGTGHAATALSRFINKPVSVRVPDISVALVSRIPELLGGADLKVRGFYFKLTGDITGGIFQYFPEETAGQLADALLHDISQKDDEMKKSALMELANITTNSYINAIADMIESKIYISVPFYSADMLGAVIDFLLIEISETTDYALLMETIIEIDGTEISGRFIFMPDILSFNKLFDRLGIK
ncbi:MAG: hypothetical protein A2297_04095 [Elusimicrobia bacterium RIFOXYB2_FULL_48_7]|nr:MAG: hypothetical protein A2297_04095 [Elusimicrobia bacterium RIFOXYB2_FULL_48_7]